jgi:hypothetical protein
VQISAATATPPRGSASTTQASKFFLAIIFASARPAARRSANDPEVFIFIEHRLALATIAMCGVDIADPALAT